MSGPSYDLRSFEMIAPMLIPLMEDGRPDDCAAERLISMYARLGCAGVFVRWAEDGLAGLTDDERLKFMELCVSLCRARTLRCYVSASAKCSPETQVRFLTRLQMLKPDAIVFECPEDDTMVTDIVHAIPEGLDPELCLGMHLRLSGSPQTAGELAERLLRDGRFRFLSLDGSITETLPAFLQRLQGSNIRVYNTCAATLLESLMAGASGYAGPMLNMFPDFCAQLKASAAENHLHRFILLTEVLSSGSLTSAETDATGAEYLLYRAGVLERMPVCSGRQPLSEARKKALDSLQNIACLAYYRLFPYEHITLLSESMTAFPECHASTVLPLADGTVLVTYFAGTHEKADDVGIWLSEYRDGAWLAPRCIAKVCQEAHWNPVIYQGTDGIHILFKVGKTIPDWVSWIMTSTDEGRTWSAPELLRSSRPDGGPVRNKPLMLQDGRMLAPASWETKEVWQPFIDESEDGGASFTTLSEIPLERTSGKDTYLPGKGAIQPTLWESQPGHVHALLRTTAGKIYRSDSCDGGRTWCTAYPTDLPNNNSGIDAAFWHGKLYLVMNPISGNWAPRTPLVMMCSEDNGKSFTCMSVLADILFDPTHTAMSEYSYPAVVAADGYLHITFTYNRRAIAYARVQVP